MEFLETIQNCLQICGIFIRFLDFSIRVLFEIFAKVYEIFSSDTPLGIESVVFLPVYLKQIFLAILGLKSINTRMN